MNYPSAIQSTSRRMKQRSRRGLASIELVMATAVALPLCGIMFLLGIEICRYVFRGLDGMLSLPWL